MKTMDVVEEIVCTSCHDSWPADTEFFYRDVKTENGLMTECKDCYNVWRRKPRPKLESGFLTLELQSLFTKLIQKPEQKALVKP